MNSIQHALMNAARRHIEERSQTNNACAEAAALWIEQLDNLMNTIRLWVSPLKTLDGFIVEEIECDHPATDSNKRETQLKSRGLKLTFADTEVTVTPAWFQIHGSLMSASGAIDVSGKGMVSWQIHYNNGSFEKMTVGPGNEINFGELSFTQVLADEVPRLKP
ncbi:hypothetical protein [Pseudomonas corrugata]|uniref:Uncharacterized protein n=1 Tax=Pseudomonas corrugata TaxID=47879 RepID=A0A3M3DXI9_9PSED|nr:hypothetical protein [Pseudomonas corrugata]RMM41931.1 hypothetical protein ALQ77_03203 [Pseudomonas corrugata]SDU86972.1 hypothetical protein SAMN04490183_0836 [Pseudomonas corrugata]